MSQEKVAEIIDLNASRAAVPGQSRNENTGEFLVGARQAAGLELETVSAATKIKIEHLKAIEQTRPDRLPATPYAVGFVKVYARFLDLDAEALAAQFKDDIGAAARAPVEFAPAPAIPQAAAEIGEGARLASVFGIIAILIFAGWIAFKILGANNASIDAGVAENQPAHDTLTVLTPRPVKPAEMATQNDGIGGEPATPELNADEAVRAGPSLDIPHSTADVGSVDAGLVIEADALADQTPSAISLTPETVIESEPKVAPPPQNMPEEAQAPAKRQVVTASKLTRSVAPIYPNRCGEDAAAMESVTLLFDVTGIGRTANARVISSTNACFDKSALKTVKRWRFEPKTVNGAAQTDAGKTATLHFRQ